MNRYTKNGGAARRYFLDIRGKPEGGGVKTPPSARRGLTNKTSDIAQFKAFLNYEQIVLLIPSVDTALFNRRQWVS